VLEAVRSGLAAEVVVAEGTRSREALRDVLERARDAGVPVRRSPRRELDRLVEETRGVGARLRAEATAPLTERDLETHPFAPDAVVVVLDGLTDPRNVGAAARSAEAAGAAMLVSRVRRSSAVTPAAVLASAGALLHLPHARVANVARALERLRGAGFWVVGLDGAAPTSIYDEPCPEGRVALVVGSEGSGLSRLVRERCDALVSLPMSGRVASLNASAALAAVLYAYVAPSRR
jgi:23S rRNA (guanosine2251-2'-O)-methyltransferase